MLSSRTFAFPYGSQLEEPAPPLLAEISWPDTPPASASPDPPPPPTPAKPSLSFPDPTATDPLPAFTPTPDLPLLDVKLAPSPTPTSFATAVDSLCPHWAFWYCICP
ncbi:hypothetical protein PCASD_21676 [Puccinia coronata f. sp. avenae]|uniref:Uncharacterized protein n=1 Tax=Puccinia coronata f. sp. avenae TaxID=200324 RepID=A0A2N5U370_9BASI|nr:hypothetical protein PCASD_21676 [Puccinia coronata f. sp. avenae]